MASHSKKLIALLTIGMYQPFAYSQEAEATSDSIFNLYAEQNYYSWKDGEGNHGYQHVTPLTLSYQKGGLNLGLRRAFIVSENKSPNKEGRVAHWSDTSLSAAYTMNRDGAWPIRFNLSTNIPNGKATLTGDEKNAVMDGHLVWQTRFGEGFNITPGINISHAFTDQDVVGFGISHVVRGKFDPNADVEKDEIDPGNDTILTLQYQHQAERWQADAGLTYQRSGTTKRGGQDYYQKGMLFSLDLGGSYAITNQQNIRVNFSHSYRKRDKYINNLTGSLEAEAFNSNGSTNYIGVDYGYYFDQKQNIHLTVDYLKINDNKYDQINALYVPARSKWSIGARYQYAFNNQLNASLSAKHFRVKDRPSPYTPDGQDFKGWNIFASLNYQF